MTNICTFKQSVDLKEIGFDIPTEYCYDNDGSVVSSDIWDFPLDRVNAPTRYEVLQWAREEHGIDAWVEPCYYYAKGSSISPKKEYRGFYKIDDAETEFTESYPIYSAAESILIDRLIELIKNKTNGADRNRQGMND